MTPNQNDFSDLDTLLEQERGCLLDGDLETLGVLLPAKEELVEKLLQDSRLSRSMLAPLEGKLQRNQLLLDGALDGIKAVSARLAALKQVRTALDTYDAQGRKKSVLTSTVSQMEKRA